MSDHTTDGIIQKRRRRLDKQVVFSAKRNDDMSVKDIRAWDLAEPGSERKYTIIRLQTISGITGYGECSGMSKNEFEYASNIVKGMPATSYEMISFQLESSPSARAGFNAAMLDIVGKAAEVPVFRLLGGPTRYRVRVFTKLEEATDQDLVQSMNKAKELGFRAFSVPVPRITSRNQGQAYIQSVLKRLQKLREEGGEGIEFVLDGNNSLTPGDAQMISEAVENFHILWFDEPCPWPCTEALSKLSRENVTPLGTGIHVRTTTEIQDLLRKDAVDIIRPEINSNGISQIRRMSAIAEVNYVAAGPFHNGGPLGTAASFHLAASIPNFFIQQIPFITDEADVKMRSDIFAPGETVKDGYAELFSGPGMGISINEKALEKYKVS